MAPIIADIRANAQEAGRTEPIDCLYAYFSEGSLLDDAEHHREQLAAIEDAGCGWVAISSPSTDLAETTDFLEAIGSTYLGAAGGA